MSRASYTYKIEEFNGRKFMAIVDTNGRTSVTNDIDNVVLEITVIERLNPDEILVIYRDSDEIWDGYELDKDSFIVLEGKTWQEAAGRYCDLLSN